MVSPHFFLLHYYFNSCSNHNVSAKPAQNRKQFGVEKVLINLINQLFPGDLHRFFNWRILHYGWTTATGSRIERLVHDEQSAKIRKLQGLRTGIHPWTRSSSGVRPELRPFVGDTAAGQGPEGAQKLDEKLLQVQGQFRTSVLCAAASIQSAHLRAELACLRRLRIPLRKRGLRL